MIPTGYSEKQGYHIQIILTVSNRPYLQTPWQPIQKRRSETSHPHARVEFPYEKKTTSLLTRPRIPTRAFVWSISKTDLAATRLAQEIMGSEFQWVESSGRVGFWLIGRGTGSEAFNAKDNGEQEETVKYRRGQRISMPQAHIDQNSPHGNGI